MKKIDTPAQPTAARNFKDEGTGKSFEKGQHVDASDGEIANYRAAGLIAGDLSPAEQIVADSAENA